jgi:hypothetical protein
MQGMRHLPRLLAAVFLAMALVPLGGAGIAAFQAESVPAFPPGVMALAGAWLLGMAALWWAGPTRLRAGIPLAIGGGLIAVFLGLFGLAGTWVAVGEPCQPPVALLATSWPAGACQQAFASGSWLIGLYLIAIGVLGGISLGVLDWLRGQARTTLR